MRMATQQDAGQGVAARPGRRDPQAVTRGPDLTPGQSAELRARQRLRNRATLVVLIGLVALFFAITISRISQVKDPQGWSRPGALAPVPTAPSR